MILLLTGQPGAGKTAYGLVRAFELKKEGREVYAHGIKDLDYEKAGFHRIEDPKDWQSLPDGSVVIIDECYTTFPNRNAASAVPPHVEAMARHRHRGFDFILIAQQGLQLDPFLRGLYEEHIHVRKKWGTRATNLKRWDQYQGNVQARSEDVQKWIRPSWIFEYYTSTTVNTNKIRIPMWARYLIFMIVVLAGVFLFLKWKYDDKMADAAAATAAKQATGLGATFGHPSGSLGGSNDADQRKWETPTDYAIDHLPRFGTMPWTAPIYDTRAVTVDPQLYCMSTSGGLDALGDYREPSCSCITEQGTKYDLGPAECRTVASSGMPYNPYRSQHQVAQQAPQQPSGTVHVQTSAGVRAYTATGSGAPYGAMHTGYGDLGVPTGRYVGQGVSMGR